MKREEIKQRLELALNEQLNELGDANHCGAGSIVKSVGRSEVRARITSVDRLACECELISVTDPRLGSLETQELRNIADQLSQQLLYLEEQLIVLEIDSVAAEAQLRSENPHVEGVARKYFEVNVGKLGITLQRYEKLPNQRRQAVAATFTRSVFCRVCIDLLTAVGS